MSEYLQEIVPINKDDLFIILNHPNAKFDYPVHYHPEYEINLVMDCTGTRVVGDSEETFGRSDLVMVGPSLPHAWKSESETNHVITIPVVPQGQAKPRTFGNPIYIFEEYETALGIPVLINHVGDCFD